MNLIKKLLRKARGKSYYPRKNDEYGQSARQRAFILFSQGFSPSQTAEDLGDISKKTARRYYADWKKETEKARELYAYVKDLKIHYPVLYRETVSSLARKWRISMSEVDEILEKPWGLKQFLSGKVAQAQKKQQEQKETQLARKMMDTMKLFKNDPTTIAEKFLKSLSASTPKEDTSPQPAPSPKPSTKGTQQIAPKPFPPVTKKPEDPPDDSDLITPIIK